MYQKGIVGILVLIVGLLIALVALGFFRSNKSLVWGYDLGFENNSVLPCGLRLYQPKKDQHVKLPIHLFGYANGCGWENKQGYVGIVEVVAPNGTLLNRGYIQTDRNDTERPYRIDTYVPITLPINVNSGTIIITNMESGPYQKTVSFPIVFR